ncbi:response regulator [Aquihabitans sp. G128]|uniref:response regulator n=1 Tax=Aquihabitans sp. G128 TaxID=2849779 RepID=UPI001C239A47|nr:response regulator [Aquihabitans sp. G128]QXC62254.1 response regulator [Aquihabitans sp. G128]
MNVHRVLVAEDNKINQVVAAGTLKKLGYVVDIVDGGGDAVAACLHTRFDAVLMDVMMPDMDGYQATANIRANELAHGTPHVPVIGLSARAMDGDREIALSAGFNDYLTKPLRSQELQVALERWIGAPVLPH